MLNDALNRLSLRYLMDYFLQCGITIAPQHAYSKTVFQRELNIQKKFLPFFRYMLLSFEAANFIQLKEEVVIFLVDADILPPASLLAHQITSQFPEKKKLIDRLSYFSMHYQQALSGMISAVSVLYPGANINFLTPLITEMEVQSHKNKIQKFLNKFIFQEVKKSFSIMEVGGGMGRFTWEIAENLHQYAHYHFTDISRFFILKAKAVAAEKNLLSMTFSQFDVTKDPTIQGVKPHSVDVLLAFNVIHATEDLKISLNQLKKLLHPEGSLILIEYTHLPLWLHLVWGFAEGWWYFADEYRENIPLISREKWAKVLNECGYQNIQIFPKDQGYSESIALTGVIAKIS